MPLRSWRRETHVQARWGLRDPKPALTRSHCRFALFNAWFNPRFDVTPVCGIIGRPGLAWRLRLGSHVIGLRKGLPCYFGPVRACFQVLNKSLEILHHLDDGNVGSLPAQLWEFADKWRVSCVGAPILSFFLRHRIRFWCGSMRR